MGTCGVTVLCLLLCSSCSQVSGPVLFRLSGKGFAHRPLLYSSHRYLTLGWNFHCSGPVKGQGFGITVGSCRDRESGWRTLLRPAFSVVEVVPGSRGMAAVSGSLRIDVDKAGSIVVSAAAPMGATTFYDLNTRCVLEIIGTGDAS